MRQIEQYVLEGFVRSVENVIGRKSSRDSRLLSRIARFLFIMKDVYFYIVSGFLVSQSVDSFLSELYIVLTDKQLRIQDCLLDVIWRVHVEISNVEILIRRMLPAYTGVFSVISAVRICLRFIP